ncbi:hypothetical protein I4U23_024488 [Adineta vaga]|nr:hypothetical protein I4U23_024488 [Adineta vaga]
MEIPNDLSSQRIYTLSVRISKGTNLLFITDQHVRVPISSDSTITKDIPVVSINSDPLEADTRMLFNDAKKTAWPEMVGKEGSYVVEHIKEQTGFTQVFTVPRNSPMTMDFRNDRVRVAVDEKGIVSETPRIA